MARGGDVVVCGIVELPRPADASHHETVHGSGYSRIDHSHQFWSVDGDIPVDLRLHESLPWGMPGICTSYIS